MRQLKLIKFCFLIVFLAGCSTQALRPNSTDASDYLEKPMYLPADMIIAEKKQLNPLTSGRYWAIAFAEKPYFNNYINTTVPTLAEYKQDPDKWRKWKGATLTGWTRFIGILSKGTKFHIIDIAPTGQGINYWVTIEIDDGQYKNITALYGSPRSLIPGMYA
jgi:hypothetical protein